MMHDLTQVRQCPRCFSKEKEEAENSSMALQGPVFHNSLRLGSAVTISSLRHS